MAYSELEQALLDRLRVNDTETLAVLADQLHASADDVASAARALRSEGVGLRQDSDGRDISVVYTRPDGPHVAAPADDKPPT